MHKQKPEQYGIATLDVRYAETDQMGVVYHANYLIWMELGRGAFLEQILNKNYMTLEENGVVSPVTEVHMKYIKSAKFGDTITIHTWPKMVSKLRVIYAYELYNQHGELLMLADTTLVCVDKENFSLIQMHKALPEWYDAYQNYMERHGL